MSDTIVIDTQKLRDYGLRLNTVNSHIKSIDRRMDSLYTKVGLNGLFDLLQADALTGYSIRLTSCRRHLFATYEDYEKCEKKLCNENLETFNKPAVAGFSEVAYNVGCAVKKGVDKINSSIDAVRDDYNNHGLTYKIVQTGLAVCKTAKGVSKVAGGIATIVGTGGAGIPIAMLSAISGGNDLFNGLSDLHNIWTDNYDKVGNTNTLKEMLVDSGERLTDDLFGNKDSGAIIGKTVYFMMDVVGALNALDELNGQLIQSPGNNTSGIDTSILKQEVEKFKQIDHFNFKEIMTTDIRELMLQGKLLSYEFVETQKVIETGKTLLEFTDKTFSIGKQVSDYSSDLLSVESDNVIYDVYDSIKDLEDKTKTVNKHLRDFVNSVYDHEGKVTLF